MTRSAGALCLPFTSAEAEIASRPVGHGVVVAGDSWQVLPRLAGCEVEVLFTDPPYGLTVKRRRRLGRERGDRRRDHLRGFGGQWWDVDSPVEDPEFWSVASDVLADRAVVASFSAARTWHRQAAAMVEAGFEVLTVWGWVTGNTYPASVKVDCEMVRAGGSPGWAEGLDWSEFGSALKPVWEPILIACPAGGLPAWCRLPAGPGLFYVPKIQPVEQFSWNGLVHPTMKPGVLLDRLLDAVGVPAGVSVLDPFLGSGSSGLAAARRGCPWIGVEQCDGREGRPDYVGLVEARCRSLSVPLVTASGLA